MSKVIGIDLGTTNSCVAIVDASQPRVLSNREGSHTTASIVAFTEEGDRLVGQIAKRQAITNPQNTIYAVKRLIGRKFKDEPVQRAMGLLPYTLVEAPNGDVKVKIRDKPQSPEEISAVILAEIKGFAEEALGVSVTQAVITVPAYFNDSQRQATRDAGQIAGLEVLRIINEPTAAALAYGIDKKGSRKRIAVYDLGGGTFDISILELADGIFEVKSTAGDTYLGGEDFDQRIMDWLIADFQADCGIDLRTDRMALQRLKEAAELSKCELSTASESAVNLPFISADQSGPRHLSRSLTREHFESLVQDLVERTAAPCQDALQQAGLRADQIDEVLLVGGQTRTPMVRAQAERIFGRAPNQDINPDEVVAVGAAIQAAVLSGEVKDVVLLDVTPLSLGVETHGGLFTRLIPRNSTIPTKNTQVFTTVEDNQETVEIHVLQGERELAQENRSLGRFELRGIPGTPRGVPQIDVTFALDSNGIVQVSARDAATGRTQSIEINPAGGLNKEEVEQLVKAAADNAAADAERRDLRRLKQRLEGMIYTTERVFDELRSTMAAAESGKSAQVIGRARMALTSDEKGMVDGAMNEIAALSQKLSEAMIAQAQKTEAAAAEGESAAAGGGS